MVKNGKNYELDFFYLENLLIKFIENEYDHLISLELGGTPKNTKNLWSESYLSMPTSHDKDRFENYLHKQVCSGNMSLRTAQLEISLNWFKYWDKAGRP